MISSGLTDLVPISIGVISLSLLAAFSTSVRAVLSLTINYYWTLVVTHSGLRFLLFRGARLDVRKVKAVEERELKRLKLKALRADLLSRAERADGTGTELQDRSGLRFTRGNDSRNEADRDLEMAGGR